MKKKEQQPTKDNGFSVAIGQVNSSKTFMQEAKDKLLRDQTAVAHLIEANIDHFGRMTPTVRRDMLKAFMLLPKFLQKRILYPQ